MMYYSSNNSRNRYYHHADCGYVKRIAEHNLLELGTLEDVFVRGLRVCPYCSTIARLYRTNRKQIDEFCDEQGYTHFLSEGEMFVVSDQDTAWRICSSEESETELYLLHESKHVEGKTSNAGSYQYREFHKQNIGNRSIMGYLEYILSHDRYRRNQEELRQKEEDQRKQVIQNIKATQRQIGRQNWKKRGSREAYTQKRRRSKQQLKALASSFSNYKYAKQSFN